MSKNKERIFELLKITGLFLATFITIFTLGFSIFALSFYPNLFDLVKIVVGLVGLGIVFFGCLWIIVFVGFVVLKEVDENMLLTPKQLLPIMAIAGILLALAFKVVPPTYEAHMDTQPPKSEIPSEILKQVEKSKQTVVYSSERHLDTEELSKLTDEMSQKGYKLTQASTGGYNAILIFEKNA